MHAPRAFRAATMLTVLSLAVLGAGCGGDEESNLPRCPNKPAVGVEWANCQLVGADLRKAKLSGAFIHDVDLSHADLRGADLSDAQLINVTADGADLTSANLQDALVNGGTIHEAKYCKTTMPDGTTSDSGC